VFVVLGLVLAFWLAGLFLVRALPGEPLWIVYLLLFWALLTYLALPRLHQLFTLIYVPDYFIGRTRTGDGLLGDPVNLALEGSEEDIHEAMQAAGWILADEITVRSTWGMIVSALVRRSYPAAPVSNLYLFGRRHAFAYQQEVDGNPSQRHHVRFWRTPDGWRLPGGERVAWLAAGTYDRSVGLSAFTGQVTHKIDADIDVERDYIINTVRYADPKSNVRVISQFSTSYHSRNGGGDEVRTDGDLPVLDVTGAAERFPLDIESDSEAGGRARRLPPVPLLGAGLLTIVSAIVACGDVLHAPDTLTVVRLGVQSLILLMWIMAVRHKRWAWVTYMAIETLAAFGTLSFPDEASSIFQAALAVLVVLAVTANPVRTWVNEGRTDPRVRLSQAEQYGRSLSAWPYAPPSVPHYRTSVPEHARGEDLLFDFFKESDLSRDVENRVTRAVVHGAGECLANILCR
jgi:hypothetical protein